MADLDPVIGSEQGGVRPVLIVQNDRGNLHSPTVIVAAMTGSLKKPALPTHVLVTRAESGLRRDSIVLLEQLRTLEKTRLTARVGALQDAALQRVAQGLRASLQVEQGA